MNNLISQSIDNSNSYLLTNENLSETLPFFVNDSCLQQSAIDIFNLIKKPNLLKLSNSAQLKESNLSQIIKDIDDCYTKALEDYHTTFKQAEEKDIKISKEKRNMTLDLSFAISTSAIRFVTKTPQIPLIKFVVGPLLGLAGSIYGVVNQQQLINEKIKLEQSFNRTKWLTNVLIKEKLRKE